MSQTRFEEVTQSLREKVMSGQFKPAEKLREVALAAEVGASRTVVRLALGKLEQEGLVEGQPNRGFTVRSFTIDEVLQAIEVRGTLEGMAARLCAEAGLSDAHERLFSNLLKRMDDAILNGFSDLSSRSSWIEMNAGFHDLVLATSGNASIEPLVKHLSRMPLVSSRAIVFDAGDATWSEAQLRIAHADHHAVFTAIRNRHGTRAEAIMREHAQRSSQNKRESFAAMKRVRLTPSIPGLELVRSPEDAPLSL